MFNHKTRTHQTLEGKILTKLKMNGQYGATNYELSRIALCYTKAISNLRAEGQNISTVRITKGLFKYYWEAETMSGDSF